MSATYSASFIINAQLTRDDGSSAGQLLLDSFSLSDVYTLKSEATLALPPGQMPVQPPAPQAQLPNPSEGPLVQFNFQSMVNVQFAIIQSASAFNVKFNNNGNASVTCSPMADPVSGRIVPAFFLATLNNLTALWFTNPVVNPPSTVGTPVVPAYVDVVLAGQ